MTTIIMWLVFGLMANMLLANIIFIIVAYSHGHDFSLLGFGTRMKIWWRCFAWPFYIVVKVEPVVRRKES